MRRVTWCVGIAIVLSTFCTGSVELAQTEEEFHFTILHTGDEHSALIPHSPAVDFAGEGSDPTVGGFARLAGMVRGVRESAGEPVLLVSAGDFIGGTPFSWLALEGHAPELTLMREIGYDVAVIGNHEFDYGPDILADYLAVAGYPGEDGPVLLAGNMVVPPHHPLSERGILPAVLLELPGGPRVGLFGLLGEDASRVAAVTDPVTFEDPFEAARRCVAELRDAGADVVIALTHSGLGEDRQLAKEVSGIDVIVGGHCHTPIYTPVEEGETIIVQAGPHLRYLGVLQLSYGPATGRVRVRNPETRTPFLLPVDSTASPDGEIGILVAEYLELTNALLERLTGGTFRDIREVVARTDHPIPGEPPLQETAMGNLVTDAMRHSVEQATGQTVDLAFQANGQIRSGLLPGTTEGREGLLSLYDLLLPVGLGYGPDGEPGYPLVNVYLTGEEVRRVLEISVLVSGMLGGSFYLHASGLTYTYDPERAVLFWLPLLDLPIPTYRAVLEAELDDGRTLSRGDEGLYSVVTDLYVAGFVPLVGEMLPRLAVTPRDERGEPVEDLSERIVYANGQELKLWQSVLSYVSQMEEGSDGVPRIHPSYAMAQGRQRVVRAFPLWLIVLAPIPLLSAVIILWWRLRVRGRSRMREGGGIEHRA